MYTLVSLVIGVLIGLNSVLLGGTSVFAAAGWGDMGTQPIEVFDRVVGEANQQDPIQNTALDSISNTDMKYDSKYRIANTLNSIRIKIAPYMQWFLFVGLAVATVLIIITGFQLVTSAYSGEDTKKARGKIKNIGIGIAIISGFYLIIQIFLSVMGYILQ